MLDDFYVSKGLMKRYPDAAAFATLETLLATFASHGTYASETFHNAQYAADEPLHGALITPVVHYVYLHPLPMLHDRLADFPQTMGGLTVDAQARRSRSRGSGPQGRSWAACTGAILAARGGCVWVHRGIGRCGIGPFLQWQERAKGSGRCICMWCRESVEVDGQRKQGMYMGALRTSDVCVRRPSSGRFVQTDHDSMKVDTSGEVGSRNCPDFCLAEGHKFCPDYSFRRSSKKIVQITPQTYIWL
ncbi:hypothetical protein C8R44DRAFT_742709 [Mycena epipterygia]|nr:hypothetical protein C8R44DRAFT_742709 [Mycena epipterygia]